MTPTLASLLLLAPQTPPKMADFVRELRRPSAQTAVSLRTWIGEKNVAEGAVRQDGLSTLWVISAPKARQVEITDAMGPFRLKLKHLPNSDLFAGSADLPEGIAMQWRPTLDGVNGSPHNLEAYAKHPDNQSHLGVPKGTVTQQPTWRSAIFAGTTRDWWVYVPAQYRPETPAAVMVFQDGQWWRNNVPNAFDNLIARGEMPPTVGIFIAPGTRADGQSNRNFEYDSLGDAYARFLLNEILPEVEKTVNLRHDPEGRAISGVSSGASCAFTVVWEHPEAFGKVMSGIGSYTNLAPGQPGNAGAHLYPSLIRKLDQKPIRVFLQDGENDIDNQFGSWWLANQQMDRAFAFKGYDYKFVKGHGFHSDNHLRAILPDALRWLWRK